MLLMVLFVSCVDELLCYSKLSQQSYVARAAVCKLSQSSTFSELYVLNIYQKNQSFKAGKSKDVKTGAPISSGVGSVGEGPEG